MKVFLVILVLGVCGALLEVGIRIAEVRSARIYQEDKDLGYRLKPHVSLFASDKDSPSTNSDGWRGPERDYSSAGKGLRIACLGDSATFGTILSEESDTYPRQLESILREKHGIKDAEVFNFGVNGYSTYQAAVLMKERIPAIRPDVAIAFFGWNDAIRFAGWHNHRERVAYQNSIWHRSAVVRAFFRLTDPWIINGRLSGKLRLLFGEKIIKHAQSLDRAEEDLLTFVARSREHAILPILVTRPLGTKGAKELREDYLHFLQKGKGKMTSWLPYYAYNLGQYNERVRKIARRSGATLVDLASEFESFSEEEIESYFPQNDFAHPNAKGCRWIAERLAPVVLQGRMAPT